MAGRGTVLAVAALAGTLVATACVGRSEVGDGAGRAEVLGGYRLLAFDACDELLGWVHEAALERVGPYGLDGGGGVVGGDGVLRAELDASMGSGAAPTPTTNMEVPASATAGEQGSGAADAVGGPGGVSATNTVEAGVDEPDLVKTDGRLVVAIAGGRLQVLDPGAGSPTLLGSMELPLDAPANQLLLAGPRAVLLGSSYGVRPFDLTSGVADSPPGAYQVPKAILREVDLSDPAAPRIVATLEVEGSLVDTRVVDGVARVVVRSQPAGLDFVYPSGPGSEARAEEINRQVVADSTIDQWLPSFALDAGGQHTTGRLVGCDAVHHPATFSGFSTLSVLTVDLGAGLTPGDGAAVLADGQRVYASPENLYVALDQAGRAAGAEAGESSVPGPSLATSTVVHKFATPPGAPADYVASGVVDGLLLNDFSLSEHEGVLRVATTVGSTWAARGPASPSESFVTTLGHDGDQLVQLGRVGGLGQGEQIFGVRFLGPVGYVVTFRQTDPLYTVDLGDPANPTVRGELKIPGYSAYLHPLGDGRLLGVGQDATEAGIRTGAQVSLFDVSDLANPQRLSQLTLPDGWTSAEHDRHAFLWWAPAGLAVLPVDVPSAGADGALGPSFSGVVGIGVEGDQLAERGRFGHPERPADCGTGVTPVPVPAAAAAEPAPGAAATEEAPATTLAPVPPGGGDGQASAASAPAPWCSPFAPPISRSLVIGDVLYTLSDAGLQANDLATLSTLGWAAFA